MRKNFYLVLGIICNYSIIVDFHELGGDIDNQKCSQDMIVVFRS